MKFEITEVSRVLRLVTNDQLGTVGKLLREYDEWRFIYQGQTWTKLTHDQNTSLQEFIREPLMVLNITFRLTK